MTAEAARMLIDVSIRRIHEATTIARTGKNSEDPYDRVYFEDMAQEKFLTHKKILEDTIARYLECASREVGLSHTPDVPG
jgi:hypothetical protein